MSARPAPSSPYLWCAWRDKFVRALLLGAEQMTVAQQAERAINLLEFWAPITGPVAEIATISAPRVPQLAREVALERLADHLVQTWRVHSPDVRAALQRDAAESGCSVPTVKRQALRAAAWEVINHEMELPQRSRLAPAWLVDATGRRMVVPPADWMMWELEQWVIATSIREAEAGILASAGADVYGEPDDGHVLLNNDDDDPDIDLFERRRELLNELASPSERVLLSAMWPFLRAQAGTGIYGALSAAARELGISEAAARNRFARLRARLRGRDVTFEP
jgi:hypothetical protein